MEITACLEPGCGAPAEVVDRWVLDSTDGPIEHLRLRCLARHVLTPTTQMVARATAERARAGAGGAARIADAAPRGPASG